MQDYNLERPHEGLDGLSQIMFKEKNIRKEREKEVKNCKTIVKNLRKLGVDKQKSYEWGNTIKGYCRLAYSPILCRALTNDYFRSQG
jgi:RNA-directed DNA polymerase